MNCLAHIRSVVLFGLSLATLPLATTAIADDYVAPNLIHVTTPNYSPDLALADLSVGRYEYSIRWQGIPAARASIEVSRDGGNFRVESLARSSGAVRIFYELQHRAVGILSGIDLQPLKTLIDSSENSKRKLTEISFADNGSIHTVRVNRDKQPEVTQFFPGNDTVDPFAGAWRARFVDWDLNEERTFDVFNGKTRYLISLKAVDQVTMEVNGEERRAWVIVPSVQNLSYPTAPNKLREARIYLAADRSRDILSIESEVFIGTVTATLDSYTPPAGLPAGMQIALASRTAKGL